MYVKIMAPCHICIVSYNSVKPVEIPTGKFNSSEIYPGVLQITLPFFLLLYITAITEHSEIALDISATSLKGFGKTTG
jgi:hypothetical protein